MSKFNFSEFNSILNYIEHKLSETQDDKSTSALHSYAQSRMYDYELQYWYKLKFEIERDFMKGLFNSD